MSSTLRAIQLLHSRLLVNRTASSHVTPTILDDFRDVVIPGDARSTIAQRDPSGIQLTENPLVFQVIYGYFMDIIYFSHL